MGVYETFRALYIRKPKYIALNIAAFFIYYFVMRGIVLIDNKIILFNNNASEYLFYLIAITSSVLVTLAIYSAFNTKNNRAKVSAPVSGSAVALAGSFAVSCGCSFSALSYLAVIGLSTGSIISLDTTIANYETPLMLAALVLNLVILGYYSSKLSKPSCAIRKPKKSGNSRKQVR
ncbi:hypothetical protein Micr_00176 [Candidatus Micrarchaeum sp.]|jgi:hypothetical protein|uniref:hypothetical protein n=1 Tax=Candidatus Micrarchaeum sp. TaxID=2282148 RepID=UPI00092B6B26|nr:hypothetical protein [Candidatus Micrarchaeum sp.]OJI08285.1 MAG: hypothetical protein BK997_00505 [Candidatus Micrarchaeum sp. ARMAN-1]OJT94355.1 MAG: hypothetical protein JJ59_02660 [Candidatus Micrarchaeum sp. AZ1]OWP53558.1 MAG: hypothetical protein B2I19_03930 [Thermoplasmatales archaeon ARMAN]QRF73661.1 hypothetical protein Micr_00176 [Candidatus Micrarchaeum sp.]